MLPLTLVLLSTALQFRVGNAFNITETVAIFDEILRRTKHHHTISNVPLFVGAEDVNRTLLTAIMESSDKRLWAARYIFTESGNSNAHLRVKSLRNYIGNDALNIVLCQAPTDRIWRAVDQRLRRLRQTKLVVILVTSPTATEPQPAQIFRKIWQLQFLHAVLLYNNTIYRYTPFPHLHFFPAPTNHSDDDLFPHASNDLQGYTISTPAENDLPRIFFVRNYRGYGSSIRGFAFKIFENFLRRMNITLHISNPNAVHDITSSVNMSTIIEQIARQQLEISMHPYTSIREHQGILSYPIFKLACCLIVPVRNEIPRYLYPIRPLDMGSWLFILLAMIYTSLALVWTSPCVPVGAPFLTKLSRTFLESIAQVAFLPSTYQSQQPSLRYLLVYLQLAIFGLLLTSCYNNLLSSFYTVILVGEQLDTFESLIAAQLPILTKYNEIDMVLEQVPPTLVPAVRKLIVGANSSVQMSHLLRFNNTYAYPVTEERWSFLSLQEQYSNKPLNRFSRICLGSPCIGFPMRLDSHLEHPLKHFILDVQMSGLDFHWLLSDFKDALKEDYVKLVDQVWPFKALDLYTFYVAWILLAGGLSLSLCVFLIEIRSDCRKRKLGQSRAIDAKER